MTFVSPLWLWLGLALIIPVLVHLWNRRPGRPRLLGTFRFLPDESFASARRLELHEIGLLFLRMGMIVVLVLLLADWFWMKEKPGTSTLRITETESAESSWIPAEDEERVYEVSEKDLRDIGWWNLLAQLDYKYQPKNILASGTLAGQHFGYQRAVLSTGVQWQENSADLPAEKILVSWNPSGEGARELIHRHSDEGLRLQVQLSTEATDSVESLSLIINADNQPQINEGLRYASAYWGIRVSEGSIPGVARLIVEDNYDLYSISDSQGPGEQLDANGITGIPFVLTHLDTTQESGEVILRSPEKHIPLLFTNPAMQTEWKVNGLAADGLGSWYYAGVTHAWLTELLRINEQDALSPVMPESQRSVRIWSGSEDMKFPQQKASARYWLLALLAFLWLAERWIAPGRGM